MVRFRLMGVDDATGTVAAFAAGTEAAAAGAVFAGCAFLNRAIGTSVHSRTVSYTHLTLPTN